MIGARVKGQGACADNAKRVSLQNLMTRRGMIYHARLEE